jgi:hypothetical protein
VYQYFTICRRYFLLKFEYFPWISYTAFFKIRRYQRHFSQVNWSSSMKYLYGCDKPWLKYNLPSNMNKVRLNNWSNHKKLIEIIFSFFNHNSIPFEYFPWISYTAFFKIRRYQRHFSQVKIPDLLVTRLSLTFRNWIMIKEREYYFYQLLLFNANSAIFQLYHDLPHC